MSAADHLASPDAARFRLTESDAVAKSDAEVASGPAKDQLVLAMLAVMGGESRDVNERDLFLACWHAFPNAMRWVDTVLPNPDTFTASLRRLDSKGFIQRKGKATRTRRRRRKPEARRKPLDPGRSGVVRASIVPGALARARVDAGLVATVSQLVVPTETYATATSMDLILACVALRTEAERHVDEGVVTETAFHKFPGRFAYEERPEWPDVQRVRDAIREGQARGFLNEDLKLTAAGDHHLRSASIGSETRLDNSASHGAGAIKFAERVETTPGYKGWIDNRTLSLTKGDELYRMLRVPPTTDPEPVAQLLKARQRELMRVDRSSVADYLLALAERWNPDVYELAVRSTEGGEREDT